MQSHDLEIEITKSGQVKVHIQGVKGKSCLDYAQLLAGIVGKEEAKELTAEYYEPDSQVKIAPQLRQKSE